MIWRRCTSALAHLLVIVTMAPWKGLSGAGTSALLLYKMKEKKESQGDQYGRYFIYI